MFGWRRAGPGTHEPAGPPQGRIPERAARRYSNERQGAYPMIMALPFVLGLVTALLAVGGRRNAALGFGVVTVVIQVWWLVYHATDTLAVSL